MQPLGQQRRPYHPARRDAARIAAADRHRSVLRGGRPGQGVGDPAGLAWLSNQAELSDSDRWLIEDHVAELASLTDRIKAIEAKIQTQTKDDPLVARLQEQSGVGPVTAVTMRAEIGRFDRFDTGKQRVFLEAHKFFSRIRLTREALIL